MMENVRKVAILGGGITGLSAAFYLRRLAEQRGLTIETTVLEGSGRLGGRVNTLRRDGFVIERGPDSFLARKLPMIRLAEALGIDGQLTGTNPAAKKTYISRDGRLRPMPEGLTLGIPADIEKFMQTDLVSEAGKLRALEEQHLPADLQPGDESVGSFLERRMGREMVERIFEPLLAGIHAGDLYGLGLQATFPQFKELVDKHGSLIRGMAENRRLALANAASSNTGGGTASGTGNGTGNGSAASVFLTFKGGLSTLIEALEQRLKAEGCDIRLNAKVTEIEKLGPAPSASSSAPYLLRLSDGGTLEADCVLLAVPAYNAAPLLDPHTDISALTQIRYVSVANVVFGYDAARFDHALDGSGFLVPRGEGRHITASTWTSSKWLHTAPAGKRLIRCYVGRAGDESGVELPDDEMTAAVRRDLQALMGLKAAPEFAEITRLRRSMPQYPIGHVDAIAQFREALSRHLPGVLATGAPFGGVGLPDCIAQGKAAAEQLLGSLSH